MAQLRKYSEKVFCLACFLVMKEKDISEISDSTTVEVESLISETSFFDQNFHL